MLAKMAHARQSKEHQPRDQETINQLLTTLSVSHVDLSTQSKDVNVSLSQESGNNVWQNLSATQHRKFCHQLQPRDPTDPIPAINPTTSHPDPHPSVVYHRSPISSDARCICLCPCCSSLPISASPINRQHADIPTPFSVVSEMHLSLLLHSFG